MLKKTSNRWLMRKQVRNLYVGLRETTPGGWFFYDHFQPICTVEGQQDLTLHGCISTGFYQWWVLPAGVDVSKYDQYVIISDPNGDDWRIHGSGSDIEKLGENVLRVDIGQQSVGYMFDNEDGVSLASLFGSEYK